jgi:hypothetical protein
VEKDPCGRLSGARAEVDYIVSKKDLTTVLTDAGLPLRITHNDTKISNILFPTNSELPPIVIDLDTVMPGLALFDYGDLVRSAASSAAEDEEDIEKVFIDKDMRKALTEGYLSTAGEFLTPEACDQINLTALLRDDGRELLQNTVTRWMTESVVHKLEVIEIHEGDGRRPLVPAQPCQLFLQRGLKATPIVELGQEVPICLTAQFQLVHHQLSAFFDHRDLARSELPWFAAKGADRA